MAFARTEVKELEPMVKAGKKKFVRYQEGAELYSMGLHTFEELAKEAGAIYKIRRVVLVNLEILRNIWTPLECKAKYSVLRGITYRKSIKRNYFFVIVAGQEQLVYP